MAAADLNGDGKPDLAIANTGANTVSVLLNDGDGTFAPKVDYPTNAQPGWVVAADLNGDGALDLAVTCFGTNSAGYTVSVLLNVCYP